MEFESLDKKNSIISRDNLSDFTLILSLEEKDSENAYINEIKDVKLSEFSKMSYNVAYIYEKLEKIPFIIFEHTGGNIKVFSNQISVELSRVSETVAISEDEKFEYEEEIISKYSSNLNFLLGIMLSKIEKKEIKYSIEADLTLNIKEYFIQNSFIKEEKIKKIKGLKEDRDCIISGIKIDVISKNTDKKSYIITEHLEGNQLRIHYSVSMDVKLTSIDLNNIINSTINDVDKMVKNIRM